MSWWHLPAGAAIGFIVGQFVLGAAIDLTRPLWDSYPLMRWRIRWLVPICMVIGGAAGILLA